MRQLLIRVLSSKCVISYENTGYGLRAIQKYFEIDKELIEAAEKHGVIGKLRGLKLNQIGESYSRQSMLEKYNLGNDQLKNLKSQNTVLLW